LAISFYPYQAVEGQSIIRQTAMATALLPKPRAISPLKEMGAYEALWAKEDTTFASLAAMFRESPDSLPSSFVTDYEAKYFSDVVLGMLRDKGIRQFGIRVNRAGEYPKKLRDAEDPVELLYHRGWWDLVETRSVAVVGTRQPSPEALKNTSRLARLLVEDGFTIVSGLARGIDTAAHMASIEAGGKTIAVIGTPLTHSYPRENAALQERIASDFLVVSQVPVYRYSKQDYRRNRGFFPERNKTMSALTEATIIVEAGQTSGTLIQARAALKQGRKLFILEGSFRNSSLTWPHEFESRGAVRVKGYRDIRRNLAAHADPAR
jgi:DNA processing protein